MRSGVYMILVFFIAATLSAVSCMDFGWRTGQFVCDGPDQCPPGFFCDLEQGYCVEGDGPDVDTDTDVDTDSDTDSDTDTDTGECTSPADCSTPECGNVDCNGDNECEYGVDGGICEIAAGECYFGTCTSEGVSDPPVCEFEIDWQGCEPGDVCEGEPDYLCVDGTCVDGVVANEQRLTTNPGETHHPSVVATNVGFSAVWVDEFNMGYGHLFFATFTSAGILVASSQVGMASDYYEYPALVWLGPGDDYALVYQRWMSNHEVMLDYLDSGGALTSTSLQISDGDSADSRYPEAAMGVFGSDRRLAIVWQDKRNDALYKHDAYVSVVNLDTTAVISSNQRLTDDPRDEMWASVVATDDGFLVSITAFEEIAGDVSGQVLTRKVTSDGTLVGPSHSEVTPDGDAIPPAVVAWDDVSGNAALAWRDRRIDGEFRVMFRLLDSSGVHYGSLEDGLVVGPSHNAGWSQNGLSMFFHNAPVDEFVLAWDGVPGDYSGDVEVADLMVSRVAADGESVDSAYILCGDPGRSVWPRIAQFGSVALVLWQDNRDDNILPVDGEIYAATLDCQ